VYCALIFSPTESEESSTAFEAENIATELDSAFVGDDEGEAEGVATASALFDADGVALGLATGVRLTLTLLAAIADEPVAHDKAIPNTAMTFRRERFSIS
jgi:hypothetical protein